jgi:N-acetylglutamate synthase-like GNAT family acetyltransferase
VNIRQADAGDALELARLSAQLGYPTEAPDVARRLALLLDSPRSSVLVAHAGAGRLYGFVGVERRTTIESGERVEITGLVVDAQLRRGGVGRTLVAAAEAWARQAGVHEIFLRSNVSRSEAHEFYPSLGYAVIKTQHAYAKRL